MIEIGTISPEDLDLIFVTDDPQEGVNYIKRRHDADAGFSRAESAED